MEKDTERFHEFEHMVPQEPVVVRNKQGQVRLFIEGQWHPFGFSLSERERMLYFWPEQHPDGSSAALHSGSIPLANIAEAYSRNESELYGLLAGTGGSGVGTGTASGGSAMDSAAARAGGRRATISSSLRGGSSAAGGGGGVGRSISATSDGSGGGNAMIGGVAAAAASAAAEMGEGNMLHSRASTADLGGAEAQELFQFVIKSQPPADVTTTNTSKSGGKRGTSSGGDEPGPTVVLKVATDSRVEREQWILCLLFARLKLTKRELGDGSAARPPTRQSLWALDEGRQLWFSEPSRVWEADSKLLLWWPVKSFRRHSSWGHATGHFVAVAAGAGGIVWGLGNDGRAYAYRFGGPGEARPDADALLKKAGLGKARAGDTGGWLAVPPAKGVDARGKSLVHISVGAGCVWAVTARGSVYVRLDVTPKNPTGAGWELVSREPPVVRTETSSCVAGAGVWAVSSEGYLLRRVGFSARFRAGTHWVLGNGTPLPEFAASQVLGSISADGASMLGSPDFLPDAPGPRSVSTNSHLLKVKDVAVVGRVSMGTEAKAVGNGAGGGVGSSASSTSISSTSGLLLRQTSSSSAEFVGGLGEEVRIVVVLPNGHLRCLAPGAWDSLQVLQTPGEWSSEIDGAFAHVGMDALGDLWGLTTSGAVLRRGRPRDMGKAASGGGGNSTTLTELSSLLGSGWHQLFSVQAGESEAPLKWTWLASGAVGLEEDDESDGADDAENGSGGVSGGSGAVGTDAGDLAVGGGLAGAVRAVDEAVRRRMPGLPLGDGSVVEAPAPSSRWATVMRPLLARRDAAVDEWMLQARAATPRIPVVMAMQHVAAGVHGWKVEWKCVV